MLHGFINNDELFDIVDREDNIIKVGVKEEDLHLNDDITRVVTIYVFDQDGRFLVGQRSNNKKVDPGKYEAPAHGRVNSGESYEQAAKREVKEELGVNLDSYEVVDYYYTSFDTNVGIRQHYKKLFIGKVSGKIRFCEKEMLGVQFFSNREIFFDYYKGNKGNFSQALELDVLKLKKYFKKIENKK